MNIHNATITFEELSGNVNGFTFFYKGVYNIFINSNLDIKKLLRTMLHEFAHIELNHMCQCNKDMIEFYISGYEDEAEEYLKQFKL